MFYVFYNKSSITLNFIGYMTKVHTVYVEIFAVYQLALFTRSSSDRENKYQCKPVIPR